MEARYCTSSDTVYPTGWTDLLARLRSFACPLIVEQRTDPVMGWLWVRRTAHVERGRLVPRTVSAATDLGIPTTAMVSGVGGALKVHETTGVDAVDSIIEQLDGRT